MTAIEKNANPAPSSYKFMIEKKCKAVFKKKSSLDEVYIIRGLMKKIIIFLPLFPGQFENYTELDCLPCFC